MLLDPSNEDLLKQFLPKSYQRVKGLTSLEGAVLAFREQLPEGVLAEIMQLVSPYSTSASQGAVIWPYDAGAAAVIDEVLMKLTVEDDAEGAAAATDQIEYDAFVALVNTLVVERYDQCRGYLLAIVHYHFKPDIRFNAAQLLFDHYELSGAEALEVATYLDNSALEELYSSELISFVTEELNNNTDSYGLDRALDELPGWTRVEEIYIEKISFDVRSEVRQVRFDGTMDLSLAFVFDREEMGEHSFSGVFSGYFDEHGIYLDDASIDTNSYYGHTADGSE